MYWFHLKISKQPSIFFRASLQITSKNLRWSHVCLCK